MVIGCVSHMPHVIFESALGNADAKKARLPKSNMQLRIRGHEQVIPRLCHALQVGEALHVATTLFQASTTATHKRIP